MTSLSPSSPVSAGSGSSAASPPSSLGPCGAAPLKPPLNRLTSSQKRNCSASVMGLLASSPSSEYRIAGFMLASVVNARPPHYAVRQRPADAPLRRVVRPEGLPQHYSRPYCSPLPATGPQSQERTCRSVLSEPDALRCLPLCGAYARLPQRVRCRRPTCDGARSRACVPARPLPASGRGTWNVHRPALERRQARRPAHTKSR